MKLLKISDPIGQFLQEDGTHQSIDKLTKEDFLRLVNCTLYEEQVEFDDYDEGLIKNHAHRIIYKSVARKLVDLRGRRQEFIDQSARLFLPDYEKYTGVTRA